METQTDILKISGKESYVVGTINVKQIDATSCQNVSQNVPTPEPLKSQIIARQKAEAEAKRQEERIKREQEEQERLRLEEEQRAKVAQEEQERQQALLVASTQTVTSRSSEVRESTTTSLSELQQYAHDLCIGTYGWTENDFNCLVNLVNKESGWNVNSVNKSSGAGGLFQALPASKMASEGSDYATNGKTQIRWGLKYIQGRYGTPASAWLFWQSHGWY